MPKVTRFTWTLSSTLGFVLCGLGCSGGVTTTATGTPPATAWQLVWSDEFSGAAGTLPAANDWNFEAGPGPSSNHEIQLYCVPGSSTPPCSTATQNAYEDGQGHLVLNAVRTASGWSSARLNTLGKHELTYGRVEARIRMTPGDGFWPAFWLLGNNHHTAGWPLCGEQDILEWVQAYSPTTTSSTVHGPGYSASGGIGSHFTFPNGGRIDDAQFHTYGMTRSPNRMDFYRDDPSQPYFVVTPASLPANTTWVYDHPFFVILNFAIGGGGFSGVTDATTPASGQMTVDYVRFYQLR
jgi:beta-glucanase (GH16 family)